MDLEEFLEPFGTSSSDRNKRKNKKIHPKFSTWPFHRTSRPGPQHQIFLENQTTHEKSDFLKLKTIYFEGREGRDSQGAQQVFP